VELRKFLEYFASLDGAGFVKLFVNDNMPCPDIYIKRAIFEKGLITEIIKEARTSKIVDCKVV
jgi:hypothetical protein